MNNGLFEEEALYEQLRKLGQRLHIPIPEAFWELEVRDGNGKVIRCLKQRSHSWVRNAYNVIFSMLAGKDGDDATFEAGKLNLKRTDGVIYSGSYPLQYYQRATIDATSQGYRGPAGQDEWGILLGSGTNPESFEDYGLQTKIADGTGAGQLSYIESEPHSITYEPATLSLKNTLVRYFNNNSGGDIDVNEVGLAANSLGTMNWRFLMARDKLTSTVTVPNTGQLKVTYTVQLSYAG